MIDCKDTINFKRAIFIKSKLNVYSRLTFSKEEKQSWKKTKITFYVEKILLENKELKLRENFRAGSFGTVPGPIIGEY